ncbi:MAG TPA: DUF4364 family protein [Clostridiales bacterium]|nr:DUF4364 family protein [Clostridiales bacterium]
MDIDALSAGVQPGGLINRAQIRLLVCYLLKTIKEPVPKSLIQEVFHYEGLANYFEVAEALSDLHNDGHIILEDEHKNTYTASVSGIDIANTLESELPYTVRERAFNSVLKTLTKLRREKENKVEIQETSNGYLVCLTVLEKNKELMSLKLLLPDHNMAKSVENIFLDDPSKIYAEIIELLAKEFESHKDS